MVRWGALALLMMVVSGCVAPTQTTHAPEQEHARDDLMPEGAVTQAPTAGSRDRATTNLTGNATAVVIPVAQMDDDTTLAPWWFISTQSQKNGGVAGYVWTVPKEALLPDELVEDWPVLPLQLGFVRAGNTEVTGFIFSIFLLESTGAQHLYTHVGMPYDAVLKTTPVVQSTAEGGADFAPFHLNLWADRRFSQGDRLGFVLAGFGKGDLGLAFRLLDEPVFEEDAPEDEAALLRILGELGPGMALTARGRAEGAHLNAYQDFNYGVSPGGLFGIELRMGEIHVWDELATEAARPAATLRQTKLESAPSASEGYAFVTGIYYGEPGVADYHVVADTYGERIDEAGVAVGAYLPGYYAFTVMGDGGGGSKATFEAVIATANDLQIFGLVDFGFAAPLDKLVGTSSVDDHASFALFPVADHPEPLSRRAGFGTVQLAIELP